MHPTAWRDLQALPRTGAPFLAPQFFELTERFLGTGPSCLIGARARDMRGVLPLVRNGRVLAGLRSEHSPRFDMIGDAGALPLLWQELVADKSWRVLRLDGVAEDSPLVHALPELARRDGCHDRLGRATPH